MCMFSNAEWISRLHKPVAVHGTNIFGRLAPRGTQVLVYQMAYSAAGPVAMILPLPVSSRAEDAVRFIAMEHAGNFFNEMDVLIASGRRRWRITLGGGGGPGKPKLKVYDVGAYEASYVPSLGDFDRLDERFRLSDDVWRALPGYADYGFAVFRLKDGDKRDVHPMAFEFPTREPHTIFFPTVHVHDGEWREHARFHHQLYVQGSSEELNDILYRDGVEVDRKHPALMDGGRIHGRSMDFTGSWAAEHGAPAVERARFGTRFHDEGDSPLLLGARDMATGQAILLGVLDAHQRVDRFGLSGRLANRDVRVKAVAGTDQPYELAERFADSWAGRKAQEQADRDKGIDHLDIV